MKLKAYINFLTVQGVWLWTEKGLLKWHNPNTVITDDVRAVLSRYKAKILPLLKGRKADDFIRQNLNSIILGNNQNILQLLPDNSVDSFISDPPYGYGFMRKTWDKPVPPQTLEVLFQKLKPGGWIVLITAPRQDVQLIILNSLRDAGFEMNFSPIYWTYASGFPKAHRLNLLDGSYTGFQPKPAVEVILVARKPLSEKSGITQAMKDRKGITRMDDCRIPLVGEKCPERNFIKQKSYSRGQVPGSQGDLWIGSKEGRFPANLLVSDDVLDNEIEKTSVSGEPYLYPDKEYHSNGFLPVTKAKAPANYNDQGGYSRHFSLDAWAEHKLPFLIVPKASKKEKELGLEELDSNKVNDGWQTPIDKPFQRGETKRRNTGPCVKPIKLMAYLVTMFSRPGDIIIDPYAGTGSTCIAAKLLGRNYIGIEQSEEYHRIAEARLKAATDDNKYFQKLVADAKQADDKIQEQDANQSEPKPCYFTNDPDLMHLNTKGVSK